MVTVFTKEKALELRKNYQAIETIWKFIQSYNEPLRKNKDFKEALKIAQDNGINTALYNDCLENWDKVSEDVGRIIYDIEKQVDAETATKLRLLASYIIWPIKFSRAAQAVMYSQHWFFTKPPKDKDLLPIELEPISPEEFKQRNFVYGGWLEENFFTTSNELVRAIVYGEDRYYEYNFQDLPVKSLLKKIKATSTKWGEAAREAAKKEKFRFDKDFTGDYPYTVYERERLDLTWNAAPEELRNEHTKDIRRLIKIVWKYHHEELARKDGSKYRTIQQGKATNQLARTDFRIRPEQLSLCGDAVIEKNGYKVFIEQLNQLKNGVRPTAQQLLDALLIEATESSKNPEESEDTLVTLPLKKYMQVRGLSDEKSARAQVKEDLDALSKLRIYFAEKNNNYDFPICGGKGIVRGVITIRFDKDFFKLYRSYPVMAYHEELLKIKLKTNPYSLGLGRRILEHKNMNIGKSNENIMSVATLLDAIPDMPRYEELGDAGQLRKRIIDPFERDMNYFEKTNMFTWHYCGKSGAEVSEPTTRIEFEKSLIKFTWLDYPDQTERLKKIAERAAAREEEKKTKPKKKRKTKAQSAS